MPTSLIPPEKLDRMLAAAADAPPGVFVEIGVYQGGSAVKLYELAERQGRSLYLFDTFAGHPRHDPARDDAGHWVGRFADAADPAELQRLMPHARIVVGEFPASLIDLPPVAFVHADADLYDVTKAIATVLPPRMVPGGVLWFDDFGVGDCPGCTQAVHEVFGPNATHLVRLP